MQQIKTILTKDKGFFLVKRSIQYETGFEPDLALVGSRYEIWADKYQDKYEKNLIEEYIAGKVVHYCQLYSVDTDEEMLKIFAEKVNSGK
ncbi:MAG: hypothetical protein LLG02_11370 [Pelosinus sp.]|nr:hypothetical protein [Pelosinus sp.]